MRLIKMCTYTQSDYIGTTPNNINACDYTAYEWQAITRPCLLGACIYLKDQHARVLKASTCEKSSEKTMAASEVASSQRTLNSQALSQHLLPSSSSREYALNKQCVLNSEVRLTTRVYSTFRWVPGFLFWVWMKLGNYVNMDVNHISKKKT